MADIITNLHPDNDPNTNLYPNIKKENIPNKSITTNKLDDDVLSLIGSLKPSGTDTSTNILAYTSNKGIYVATDNGHWYYWNGSAYADGGIYQTAVNYDELENRIEEIESAQSVAYSLNKFDLNTYSEGQINDNNGTITPDTDYWTSDFIDVKKGDVVWYSKISNGNIYFPTSLTIVGLALYDEHKNFIAASKVNWVQAYVINNSNAKYIKVTVNKFNTETEKVCIGLNGFATQSSQFDDTPANKYNNVTSFKDFNQAIKYRYSYNRLNPSTISVATQINSLGVISESSSYETSDYIMVEPNDVVYYTEINAERTQFWRIADLTIPRLVLFDKDKNVISSVDWTQSYVIPANGKYIRCMFTRNTSNKLRVISVNEYPKNFWDFQEFKFEGYSIEPDYAKLRQKRRVLWLGSSIPTYGYPEMLGNNCHATIINNARGGSQIIKGIKEYVSDINPCGVNNRYHLGNLCQSRAEKQTMINNWEAICNERGIEYTPISESEATSILNSSYETALDPYLTGDNAVDIIVLNFGYNDPASSHTNTYDVFNMQGAHNWIISRILGVNPNMGIILFGNYNWLGDEKEARFNEISNEWGITYFELRKLLGWTYNKTVTSTLNVNAQGKWESVPERVTTPQSIWLGDGIHPIGVASEKIAKVTAPYFKNWLEMYCDE